MLRPSARTLTNTQTPQTHQRRIEADGAVAVIHGDLHRGGGGKEALHHRLRGVDRGSSSSDETQPAAAVREYPVAEAFFAD